MKNDMSFKLDDSARLWVRTQVSDWKLASREETEQVFATYPEIAVQVFWVGEQPAKSPALALAA